MNSASIRSTEWLFAQIDVDSRLKLPMCRDARKLRDQVLDLVWANSAQNINSPVIQQWYAEYNPLDYSIPIMCTYTYSDDVIEAIKRSTSVSNEKDVAEIKQVGGKLSKAGSAKGKKRADIDWLSVAKCDQEWWLPNIRRKLTEMPTDDPNKYSNDHAFYVTYKSFENWLPYDFNTKGLFTIHNIARNYALTEINETMHTIMEHGKRSPEYLYRVLENREAVRMAELKEMQEMDERSKKLLVELVNMGKGKSEVVDWKKFLEELSTIDQNNEAFNKIKLT